jgi:predicted ATP-grasp superfamily ATP-dependent carboligase
MMNTMQMPENAMAPGAVVIGGDYQGLGIVRSLGRAGIPVCVIDDEHSISRWSRYATMSLHVPNLSDEQAIVDTLLGAARQHPIEGWILYPTRDEIVAAISRRRDSLLPHFRVPTPPWETIRWAVDKRNTYELALELGIPTPWTAWPKDDTELAALDVQLPAVIKPAIKERFMKETGAKAWRVDSRDELITRFHQAQQIVPDGQVMLQELIPGNGERQYAYCALFKDGAALASMSARRRRQHPWEFGRASTYVETIDECGLEALSVQFLTRIGYYGLVEVEYKHDMRDSAFKLLDVNPRTWGYHTLGAAAGVDFSTLLYRDQTGEDVPAQHARAGVNWLRLLTDLPTGVLDIKARRTSLASYLRSLRATDTEAVWDRRDLKPWLSEFALVPYLIARRGF